MSFYGRLKNYYLSFVFVSYHSLDLSEHVLILFLLYDETELYQIQVLVHHRSHPVLRVVITYQDVEECVSLKTI